MVDQKEDILDKVPQTYFNMRLLDKTNRLDLLSFIWTDPLSSGQFLSHMEHPDKVILASNSVEALDNGQKPEN